MKVRAVTTLTALVAIIGLPLVDPSATSSGATMVVAPLPGSTARVSSDLSGAPASTAAESPDVSADGRYVAFSSAAQLLPRTPANGHRQVYVTDTLTGDLRLVSRAEKDPDEPADSDAVAPSISADGRFVAFSSNAHNLTGSVRPTNVSGQVYVRDLDAGGSTRLVSATPALTDGGDGSSGSPTISADGRRIAFVSLARDLVAGASPRLFQVYAADVKSDGASSGVVLVSLQDARRYPRPEIGNSDAWEPDISGDGSTITFTSNSVNLVPGTSANGTAQIYSHSLATGNTDMISTAPSGMGGDNSSLSSAISGDGRFVSFWSHASNLLPGRTVNRPQIYVRDLATTGAVLVSAPANADDLGSNREPREPSISTDGRFVVFTSDARDLTRSGTSGFDQVYRRDLRTGTTELISAVASDRRSGGAGKSHFAAVSGDGRFVAWQSDAVGLVTDGGDGTATPVEQVYIRNAPTDRVDRLGGVDRYAASASVSADAQAPGVSVAYVASGAVFPDALSGSAAAGFGGGPVLLVTKDGVPAATATELKRLKPGRIVILGGLNTVSQATQDALKPFAPLVGRIDGADRYAVSAAVARAAFRPGVQVAFIASGETFPDALSGSAAAGLLGGPVLLVQKDGVPQAVADELAHLAPKRIVVLGGVNTVSDRVVADLRSRVADTTRLAGTDRYTASALVSATYYPAKTPTVYVASGEVFPDALSGSAAAIADRAPVLLVTRDRIPPEVAAELTRLSPTRIVVLGGPNTISDSLATALTAYVGH